MNPLVMLTFITCLIGIFCYGIHIGKTATTKNHDCGEKDHVWNKWKEYEQVTGFEQGPNGGTVKCYNINKKRVCKICGDIQRGK
ncbi:hypothetical protein N9948_01750 [bacterium]|nr:hypothetical protein [bacterium]